MTNGFTKRGSTIGVVVVMLAVLAVTLFALYHRAQVAPRAVTTGGVGVVTITPSTTTVYPGDKFTATLKFRTGATSTDAKAISSLTLRLTYPYSGTGAPQLDVVDAAGNQTNSITADPTLITNGWSFPVKSVTRANGLVTIDLAAIYNATTGFVSTCSPNCTDSTLATINFKANAAASSNPVTVAFDTTQSVMLTKAEPVTDILASPASAQYTVQNDTTAPTTINNLSASGATTTTMNIGWTAPSDQGPQSGGGKAATYDLRYATTAITAANFASATQVANEPTPANSGAAESMTVSGLTPNTTYFFAIESKDAAGNTSAISNVVSAATQNPNSTLTYGYKLQGVSATGKVDSATLVLYPAGSVTTSYVYAAAPTTSDANGVFRPNTPVLLNSTSLPIGASGTSYDVYVLSANHLRKKLGTMTVNFGVNSTPSTWDTTVVKAGDFDNNNVLNDVDVGALLTQYTALSVPTTVATQKFDVDLNGVINIFDISYVLANYTALSVNGD